MSRLGFRIQGPPLCMYTMLLWVGLCRYASITGPVVFIYFMRCRTTMKKLQALLFCLMMMTVSLAGCLEEDSTDDDEIINPYVEPDEINYSFTGQDSDPAVSSSDNDELIELTMTDGSDLDWPRVVVKINVNQGVWITCDHDEPSGEGCFFTKIESNPDKSWDVSEKISISEDSENLCETTSPCSVEVELTKITDVEIVILEDLVVDVN